MTLLSVKAYVDAYERKLSMLTVLAVGTTYLECPEHALMYFVLVFTSHPVLGFDLNKQDNKCVNVQIGHTLDLQQNSG